MTLKFSDIDDVFDHQLTTAPRLLDIESNVALWCIEKLGVSLFDNQIEIVEKIVHPQSKYICLAASRSSGKTFSTAIGIIKLCLDHAPYNVGVFAPKFEQAKRVVKQCEDILKNSKFVDEVVWAECTQSKLVFSNGSSILSNSASEAANVEGVHVDMVCCDESQKISDLAISQKILPMIASSYSGKVVKLGVSLYKNHFYRSFNDSQYAHLLFDWTKCNNLLKGGSIVVKGAEYSKYVIDRMPFSIKQQVFPDNPELWNNTSDTTEIDFQTQYMVKWVDSLSQVLSEQDQRTLISGTHRWLSGGLITDTYFAGLDTAGGSPNGSGKDLDYTSLSIWRKTNNHIKQKVFHVEWRGDITQAINEIYDIINPKTGRFKCQFTLVDYSNVGISLVESYKKLGVPIDGVTFGSTEKSSGKNLKNAMMDQFLFELRSGRLTYPGQDVDHVQILKKAQSEWHLMERHKGLGINDKLCVPENEGHDDTVAADLLGAWAADKYMTFLKDSPVAMASDMPMPQVVNSILNPQFNSTGKPWWLGEFSQ